MLLKRAAFNTTIYYGESLDDLNKMPTYTKSGEEEYPQGFAPEGALALILGTDGLKLYGLRSTGWVDITNIGNTNVSPISIDTSGLATTNDIDSLFP